MTLLYGEARFIGRSGADFELDVGGRSLRAPEVFLNGGACATKPPIPGLDDVAWLDNDSVLHLQQLPSHLVILGGSYIGLELGQLFGRFGSAVTVIEHGPRIAGREDPDLRRDHSVPAPKASRSARRRRSSGSRCRPRARAWTNRTLRTPERRHGARVVAHAAR